MSVVAHDQIVLDEKFRVRARSVESRYAAIKPFLELPLALAMLLVSVPIIVISMILVRLTSKGSPIYTQKRLGQGGRTITIYKIRTMYQDSERNTGAIWSLPGDPRVTPVGRLLRWAHIDELPQLVNIVRGEMSLIGPRPERPEIVAEIERELPHYRQRLRVRPGLTGLAQVQQPPDTDLDCVRRKLSFDLYYVDRMSPGLDVRTLLATVLYLARVPSDVIARIFRFPTWDLHTSGGMQAPATVDPSTDSQIQLHCARSLSGHDPSDLPVFDRYGLLPRIGLRKPGSPRNRVTSAVMPPRSEVGINGAPKQPVEGKHGSPADHPVRVEDPMDYHTDFNRARPPPNGRGSMA
jgi:lipopolysaccharide/colanic/teichoic acid biosynthesis glycosyltransferase